MRWHVMCLHGDYDDGVLEEGIFVSAFLGLSVVVHVGVDDFLMGSCNVGLLLC